jgi:hypothetical protein
MCHHAWLIIDFKAITVTGYTEKGFYPLCGLPSFFSLVLPWNTMNRREPWCQCSLFGGLGGEAACDYRTLTGKLFSAFLVVALGEEPPQFLVEVERAWGSHFYSLVLVERPALCDLWFVNIIWEITLQETDHTFLNWLTQ